MESTFSTLREGAETTLTPLTSPWVKNNSTTHRIQIFHILIHAKNNNKRLDIFEVESGIEVTGGWDGGWEKRNTGVWEIRTKTQLGGGLVLQLG